VGSWYEALRFPGARLGAPMHMPHLYLTATLIAATSHSKTTSSSGSYFPLLVIIALFAVVYFFFLRPRSQRMRQQQQATNSLNVGDEVVSAGGILGRVTAIAGDEVVVEVAPGTTLTFWRRAVNLRSAVKGAPQSSAFVDGEDGYDADEDDGAVYEDETGEEGDEDPSPDYEGAYGTDEEGGLGSEHPDTLNGHLVDNDEADEDGGPGGTAGGSAGGSSGER